MIKPKDRMTKYQGEVSRMTSEVARKLADKIVHNYGSDVSVSSETFTKDRSQELQGSSSSYVLASEGSQFSDDVDRWIRGSTAFTESTGVQGSRVPVTQRSTLATTSSLNRSSMWYVLAMLLPLFNVNNCRPWRCTPSTMLNSAELFITQLVRFCSRARANIRRLARDQMSREVFATAMDIVLVVYAIGFLVLSMYQASLFG